MTFFTFSNSTSFYNSWNPLSNNFNVLSFEPANLYNSIEFIWLATLSSFPCKINNGYLNLYYYIIYTNLYLVIYMNLIIEYYMPFQYS